MSESPTSTYDRHRGGFLSEQERLDDTHFYQQKSTAAAAEREAEHAMAMKMQALHHAREQAGMESLLRPAKHQWSMDSRGNVNSTPAGHVNAAELLPALHFRRAGSDANHPEEGVRARGIAFLEEGFAERSQSRR